MPSIYGRCCGVEPGVSFFFLSLRSMSLILELSRSSEEVASA